MTTTPADKPFAFVVMPFDPPLTPVFEIIRQAAEEAGVYAQRVDGEVFDRPIIDQIHNNLNKADFVVAFVTAQNGNVMYEVGYAVAVGRTLIPIVKAGEKIAFDINQRPHVVYERETDIGPKLRTVLLGHIANREAGERRAKVEQRELSVGGVVLSEEVGVDVGGYWVPSNTEAKPGKNIVKAAQVGFALTVRNPSSYPEGREYLAFAVPPQQDSNRRFELVVNDTRMLRVAHGDGHDECVLPLEMAAVPHLPHQVRVIVGPGVGSGVYQEFANLGLHVVVFHYTAWGKRTFHLMVKPRGFIDDNQPYAWEG